MTVEMGECPCFVPGPGNAKTILPWLCHIPLSLWGPANSIYQSQCRIPAAFFVFKQWELFCTCISFVCISSGEVLGVYIHVDQTSLFVLPYQLCCSLIHRITLGSTEVQNHSTSRCIFKYIHFFLRERRKLFCFMFSVMYVIFLWLKTTWKEKTEQMKRHRDFCPRSSQTKFRLRWWVRLTNSSGALG